ncbi:MAG: hypothetical protein WCP29_12915 [Acidobacteriota bacterium]
MTLHRLPLALTIVTALIVCATPVDARDRVLFTMRVTEQAQTAHERVAAAIEAWQEGQPVGDLFKAIKAANPEKSAIVSMRELNKAIEDKALPAPLLEKAQALINKQKAAQRTVRERVLATRNGTYLRYRDGNPEAFRSVYGSGDIGSWPTASDPNASMDIDWTVFGTDPAVTAGLRDACKTDLLNDLAGENSGLTLADFDVVITAEGHERAAGVFETTGGIDWAKRNMKRVTIVQPDGTTTTYDFTKPFRITGAGDNRLASDRLAGDPIAEMAQAEHMARFRELASKGGDYDALFDARGFLRTDVFADPNNAAAQTLWNRYMDMLSDFGVDFYRSRSATATGGCLDMAKHLQEEVLTKKHASDARLKKTLKYVSRADNISRGVPGLEKILAADPLLSDPVYRDVVDLAGLVSRANAAQVNSLIKERFGDMPDAGLAELGTRARRAILRMSEVTFQAEMDRIVLDVADKAGRKEALDKLTDDFRIIAEEGGEYGEMARAAVDQIGKMQEANEAGTIDQIREHYQSLEKIRNAERGLVSSVVDFLKQTELGRKMLEKAGKLLEYGKTPVIAPAEGQYRSGAAEFVNGLVESSRAGGLKTVELLGSAAMWAEVFDSARTAKSNADLAVALSKTLINNTFFGMVLNSAYAGIVLGDNQALAKAVMYMLVPEAALPALVEALGNTAIRAGAQTLFDAQMESVYTASTIKDGDIKDFAGLGMAGVAGARYFVDAMCDGMPEEVAQQMVNRAKATDAGRGLEAVAVRAVGQAIRSTVDNGNVLVYKQDGALQKAAAAILRVTQDITDCASVWGVEVALSAARAGDLPGGLDRGQTQALVTLMKAREAARQEARAALSDAIVRTFLERSRAEVTLDSGKAMEAYTALMAIFEQLGIAKQGRQALDAEGAPYNLYTNWATSLREKQVTAMKTVQRFADAYLTVLRTRARAEEAAHSHLGEAFTPSPRPLTGSLPLTASPEIDVQIASAYLANVGRISAAIVSTLEGIKKAKLAGAYDEDMFKRIYAVRFKQAYATAMTKAAIDAQQLHWAIEVFDKQALVNQGAKWNAEFTDLQKQDEALQEEFRAHYAMSGEFVVSLSGPAEIPSGSDARLVAAVSVKNASGVQPVAGDIAAQFTYAWTSGRASLGEGADASKTYRLDTPGTHVFGVRVTQAGLVAGKPVSRVVGEATWSVKVVEAVDKTAKTDTPTKADKPDDKTKKSDPTQTPAGGSVKFSGTAPANWTGGNTPQGLRLTRKPAKIKGPCGWDASVGATLEATFGRASTPKDAAAALADAAAAFKSRRQGAKTNDAAVGLIMIGGREGASGFSIGDYQGGIVDHALWMRRGSWSDAGYTGSSFSSNGVGHAVKTGGVITVTYSVSGGGCWDNSDRGYLVSQGAAAQEEARAILTSLRMDDQGLLTSTPYNGPKYDGSDQPKVTLVPATLDRVKVGETIKVEAVVENAKPEDAPFTYNWGGTFDGTAEAAKKNSTVRLKPTKPGKYTLNVSVDGARFGLGSAGLSYTVADYKVKLDRVGAATPLTVGSNGEFKATLTVDGAPASGSFVYRWEPSTELKWMPAEGAANQSRATLTTPGKTKVWVVVLEKNGDVLSSVAESDRIELDVAMPVLKIAFSPESAVVGAKVAASVTTTPADIKDIDFRWEVGSNGQVLDQSQDGRQLSFSARDTAPVSVTVRARVPVTGEDLGNATAAFTAQRFEVQVVVLGAVGPKPQVWREGVGLVTVENAIAVHQNVDLRADVSPKVPDVQFRYEWSVNEDSHITSGSLSNQVRITRSQAGMCEATVIVRDQNGLELGRGTGSFGVTVTDEMMSGGSNKKTAAANVAKAKTIVRQGQLDEAIALVDSAAKADPTNTEAQTLAVRWKQERERCRTQIAQARQLMAAGQYREASDAMVPAKNLHPLYRPVADAEAQLNGEWKAWDSKIQSDIGQIRDANGRREFKRATDLAAARRAEGKIGPYEQSLSEQEGWARRSEAEKEQKRQFLKGAEEKMKRGDYAGAVKAFELGFANSENLWASSDPEPPYYYKLRDQAIAKAAGSPLVAQGKDEYDRSDYAASAATCTKAIDQNPGSAEAYACRAAARRGINDNTGALADANRALELDPRNADAYRARSMVERAQGDLNAALADATRSVELAPTNHRAHLTRGLTREALKDPVGALADFDRAIAVNPNDAMSYFYRGRVRLNTKDNAGAIADYDRFLSSPAAANSRVNASAASDNRGAAKQRLGDLNGALADYEQAVSLNPQNEVAARNLANLRSSMTKKQTTQTTQTTPVTQATQTAQAETKADSGKPGYLQLDFPAHHSHKRADGQVLENGIPISGYNGAPSPIVWLTKCTSPGGDGVCYPTHFAWDVSGYSANRIMLSANLSWWGEKLVGRAVVRLTVEGAGGARQTYDLVVGSHIAEWNGGAITAAAPSMHINTNVSGPSRRWFVNVFDFASMPVTRVSVDLLDAPSWSAGTFGVVEIHGITLVSAPAASTTAPDGPNRERVATTAVPEPTTKSTSLENCTAGGTWAATSDGALFTVMLKQTGPNLDGSMTIRQLSVNVTDTLTVTGSKLGFNVRITATRPDGQMLFQGPISADCGTMTLSASLEGQTHTLALKRK